MQSIATIGNNINIMKDYYLFTIIIRGRVQQSVSVTTSFSLGREMVVMHSILSIKVVSDRAAAEPGDKRASSEMKRSKNRLASSCCFSSTS